MISLCTPFCYIDFFKTEDAYRFKTGRLESKCGGAMCMIKHLRKRSSNDSEKSRRRRRRLFIQSSASHSGHQSLPEGHQINPRGRWMVNEAEKEKKDHEEKLIFSYISCLFQNYWSMQMDFLYFLFFLDNLNDLWPETECKLECVFHSCSTTTPTSVQP